MEKRRTGKERRRFFGRRRGEWTLRAIDKVGMWLVFLGFLVVVGHFNEVDLVPIRETYALPWPALVSFTGAADGSETEVADALRAVEREFAAMGKPSAGLLRESAFQAAAEQVFAKRGLALRRSEVRFLPMKQ